MANEDTRENSPLQEKIKALMKRKDLADKELAELSELKRKEAEEIKSEIAKTVRELQEEESDKFREEQIKKSREEKNLEESVNDEHITNRPSESQSGLYKSSGKVDIYDVATHNQYNKVKELIDKPENFWSSSERNFMKEVTYNVDKIKREEAYISKKDPHNYISRLSSLISKTQT